MTRKETEMKGKEDRKKDREVGREERRGKGRRREERWITDLCIPLCSSITGREHQGQLGLSGERRDFLRLFHGIWRSAEYAYLSRVYWNAGNASCAQ